MQITKCDNRPLCQVTPCTDFLKPLQEIKCQDDNRTLCYKDGDDLVIQCKRCKQNGKPEYRRVPLETIMKSTEKEIKI